MLILKVTKNMYLIDVSQITWDKIQKIFFEYHEDTDTI
jgi:hypothetical protein